MGRAGRQGSSHRRMRRRDRRTAAGEQSFFGVWRRLADRAGRPFPHKCYVLTARPRRGGGLSRRSFVEGGGQVRAKEAFVERCRRCALARNAQGGCSTDFLRSFMRDFCSLAVSGRRVSSEIVLTARCLCVAKARPAGVGSIKIRRGRHRRDAQRPARAACKRSTTPLIVATSMAVRRPSSFCEIGPSVATVESAENCVGVRSSMCFEKIERCRCWARRIKNPICCSKRQSSASSFPGCSTASPSIFSFSKPTRPFVSAAGVRVSHVL